jgi:hypothetical protein
MYANHSMIWFESGAAVTALVAGVSAALLSIVSADHAHREVSEPQNTLLRPSHPESGIPVEKNEVVE